jgi:hypothetical protein
MGGKASMLLKTHIEKMSTYRLSKMLMKTKPIIQIDLCQTLGADEDWDG